LTKPLPCIFAETEHAALRRQTTQCTAHPADTHTHILMLLGLSRCCRLPRGAAEADRRLWEPPRNSPVLPQWGNQTAPGHRDGLATQPSSVPKGGPSAGDPAWGSLRSARVPGKSHAATSRDPAPSRVPVAILSRSRHARRAATSQWTRELRRRRPRSSRTKSS
jgi:hypothetical protein